MTRTAIVTGGTRGIGAAISTALAENEMEVIMVYRTDLSAARKLLSELPGSGHEIYQCDLSSPQEIGRLFEQITRQRDHIDLVVNNAGIGYHHPIDEVNYQSWQEAWKDILATNLIAPSNVCWQAAQIMKSQNSGHIINIGSRGGYRGEPLMPAYGASKAGLHSMTQSLARYLAPHNVFVGGIAPGFVETDMSRARLEGKVGERIKGQSPMNRVAQPEEIAHAVLQMSESSMWMTGNVWDLNGASYFH
ncbi:MAG: SDR family oxidoreductase [Bacteroidota bacterium]